MVYYSTAIKKQSNFQLNLALNPFLITRKYNCIFFQQRLDIYVANNCFFLKICQSSKLEIFLAKRPYALMPDDYESFHYIIRSFKIQTNYDFDWCALKPSNFSWDHHSYISKASLYISSDTFKARHRKRNNWNISFNK